MSARIKGSRLLFTDKLILRLEICSKQFWLSYKSPFEENNLSYTSGPRRVSITRRDGPLAGIPAQYDDYNLVFQVEIDRVVLLVNGIERPIVLFAA